jgi:hypothetical protein
VALATAARSEFKSEYQVGCAVLAIEGSNRCRAQKRSERGQSRIISRQRSHGAKPFALMQSQGVLHDIRLRGWATSYIDGESGSNGWER